MMILKDLLLDNQPMTIMYRCNSPFKNIDILYGYCYWTGKELESSDGDSYYLDDVIEKYKKEDDKNLIVWISVEWNSTEGDGANAD